ncbi:hypothetical protein [Phaeacidiphilus oryzae]|uniref:hypothetical protein n=1 Tax=Phaeacidiphilus oryzae TaxID=348818 RepID=UPI0005648BAC|nr:hypothetical protein [Phaeacidiphilus oryzae]
MTNHPDWRDLRRLLWEIGDLGEEVAPGIAWPEVQLLYPYVATTCERAAGIARDLLTEHTNTRAENEPTPAASAAEVIARTDTDTPKEDA